MLLKHFITVLGWTKTKLLIKLPNEAWFPDHRYIEITLFLCGIILWPVRETDIVSHLYFHAIVFNDIFHHHSFLLSLGSQIHDLFANLINALLIFSSFPSIWIIASYTKPSLLLTGSLP